MLVCKVDANISAEVDRAFVAVESYGHYREVACARGVNGNSLCLSVGKVSAVGFAAEIKVEGVFDSVYGAHIKIADALIKLIVVDYGGISDKQGKSAHKSAEDDNGGDGVSRVFVVARKVGFDFSCGIIPRCFFAVLVFLPAKRIAGLAQSPENVVCLQLIAGPNRFKTDSRCKERYQRQTEGGGFRCKAGKNQQNLGEKDSSGAKSCSCCKGENQRKQRSQNNHIKQAGALHRSAFGGNPRRLMEKERLCIKQSAVKAFHYPVGEIEKAVNQSCSVDVEYRSGGNQQPPRNYPFVKQGIESVKKRGEACSEKSDQPYINGKQVKFGDNNSP